MILAIISQIPPTTIAYARNDSQKVDVKVESVEVIEVKPTVKLTNEQIVVALVEKYADKYDVSTTSLMRTLRNENNTFQFDRQSELTYKAGNRWGFPAGTREKSYGVAQIHLPDHPAITMEQATNPEFAVEFMAKMFSQGKARMWMGYKG